MYYIFHAFNFVVCHTKENILIVKLLTLQYTDAVTMDTVTMDTVTMDAVTMDAVTMDAMTMDALTMDAVTMNAHAVLAQLITLCVNYALCYNYEAV